MDVFSKMTKRLYIYIYNKQCKLRPNPKSSPRLRRFPEHAPAMSSNASNFLEEALEIGGGRTIGGRVVLVEDCVETSGAFVLHHLMKRVLSPESRGAVLLLAFAHPFSHYDRILRKMVRFCISLAFHQTLADHLLY